MPAARSPKKTDYAGKFIHHNDTMQFIKYEGIREKNSDFRANHSHGNKKNGFFLHEANRLKWVVSHFENSFCTPESISRIVKCILYKKKGNSKTGKTPLSTDLASCLFVICHLAGH
jgi:hypothetical protein